MSILRATMDVSAHLVMSLLKGALVGCLVGMALVVVSTGRSMIPVVDLEQGKGPTRGSGPLVWSFARPLPPGLTVNPVTGAITGRSQGA